MPINLSGRPFLRLLDFSTEEIEYLLKLSKNFKDLKRTGTPHRYLEGKNIVLLFQKTSTRTRCAFEVGAMDLGMGVTYLDPGSSQMGKKESIEDTAPRARPLLRRHRVPRLRPRPTWRIWPRNAGVPVWNGLTTEWHPTQMLADILTVQENFNYDIKGKTLVFMGDAANNVAPLADGRVLQARHELRGLRPEGEHARRRAREDLRGHRCRERLHREVHRRREGRLHRRRRHLHRSVGVHGRARRGVGRAHHASREVPRDQGSHGHGQPRRHLPALPAGLPRHQHHHRC